MSQTITLPDAPRTVFVYAGFWWRVLAAIIDSVVIWIAHAASMFAVVALGLFTATQIQLFSIETDATTAMLLMGHAQAASFGPGGTHFHWHTQGIGFSLFWIVVYFIYCAAFESSKLQATPGKLVCRFRVTDINGNRLSFLRALWRAALYLPASWTVIGVLIVAWTRRKQGLHDLIARTLVLRATETSPVMFVPPSH